MHLFFVWWLWALDYVGVPNIHAQRKVYNKTVSEYERVL